MRLDCHHPTGAKTRGLTLVELLVVLASVAIILALLLPAFARSRDRSPQFQCINNLRQLGTAFRLWADDNNGYYPMHYVGNPNYPQLTPATSWKGQLMDYADASTYFNSMSNEIGMPNLVVCTSDKRKAAANFSVLQDSNVSYFAGLDAVQTREQMLLAGDRNMIVNNILASRGRCSVNSNDTAAWSTAIHNWSGDVILADGSAQKFSSSQLQQHLLKTGTNVNRLVFP